VSRFHEFNSCRRDLVASARGHASGNKGMAQARDGRSCFLLILRTGSEHIVHLQVEKARQSHQEHEAFLDGFRTRSAEQVIGALCYRAVDVKNRMLDLLSRQGGSP
jgi:hypothetical protein